jgi:type III secretory pathway component EscT
MEIDTRQIEFLYSLLPLVMRCLGVVAFLPVSASVRFSIVVLLTSVSFEDAAPVNGLWLYPQFLIGAAIGAALLFIKEGALVLGSVLDAGRGQTLGMILNPVESEFLSPLGGALSETIWYFCVVKGVVPLTVILYVGSFEIFPLKDGVDASSKAIGGMLLQTLTSVVVQISPILLVLACIMMLADLVFLMISALWKLDGLAAEHNLLRSYLVFFGLSSLLYFNGSDLVSDALTTLLSVK